MDRDFLFGVLAVQLGQATPQQVMAAASAYFADRSKTIPERLLADGTIAPDRFKMIQDVVATMIQAHGGDAKKTMHTLGGERAVYASFGGSIVVDDKGGLSIAPKSEGGDTGAEDTAAVQPEAAGRYRLEANAEIGRGGIGRVLVAFDEFLGREIAVKELLGEAGGSQVSTPRTDAVSRTSAAVARFLREARVTGQLEHPNIVPVYEVGQRPDGTFYYTMKLVRGRTMSKALAECGSLGDRLKLLHHYVDLCNAVAYAHSRGVVHRDLKTENVMLGEFGETVVLDWGLAKVQGKKDIRGNEIARELAVLHDAKTGHTVDGSAIGTPAYMSPEQADGKVEEIDARSDVWSLGAVLYEILTGRPPFEGYTPYEIIGKVLKDEVVAPKVVNAEVPAELSAVALKALTRDKARRYQKAGDLSSEVQAYMTGGRISAYEYSSFELLKGFVAKHKVASALVGIIFALVVASSVVLYRAYGKAEAERARAERNEAKARRSERDAHFNLAMGLRDKAALLLDAENLLGARIYAAASLIHNPFNPRSPHHRADDPFDTPQAEEMFVNAYSIFQQAGEEAVARPRAVLRHGGLVQAVAFSPDGKRLASGGNDKRIVIWDAGTARQLRTIDGPQSPVTALAFTPDGRLLVSGEGNGAVRLWSADDFRLIETFKWHEKPVVSIAVDARSRSLVTASAWGRIVAWDLEARTLDDLIPAAGADAFAVYSEATGVLALRDPERADRLILRDSSAKATSRSFSVGKNSVHSADFSADGHWLATGTTTGGVQLWDLDSSAQIASFEAHSGQVTEVAFVPGGRFLVSIGYDGALRLWDLKTLRSAQILEGHTDSVWDLALSPDGALVATSSHDGTVRLWKLGDAPRIDRLTARELLWYLEYSPDGTKIAATGQVPALWDAASLELVRELPDCNSVGVAFSPDGKLLALGGRDKLVHLWDLGTGTERSTSPAHPTYVRHLAFSPDGRSIASGSWGAVIVFDVASGKELFRVNGGAGVSFSPDGALLASGTPNVVGQESEHHGVQLWDARSGKLVKTVAERRGRIDDVTFSHDGRWLAATWFDGLLQLWDTKHLETAYDLEGHQMWIGKAVFSRDDALLATASDDRSVRVWSVRTRKAVQIVRTHQLVAGVAISPDGKTLAIQDVNEVRFHHLDYSVRDADPQALLGTAEREAGLRLDGFTLVPLEAK